MGDFSNVMHAGYLPGILRKHNRELFSIVCISSSPITEPLPFHWFSCDEYLSNDDVSSNPAQFSSKISRLGLDLLVDLDGGDLPFTLDVLEARPAPVISHFHHNPAQIGSNSIDYFVSDDVSMRPFLARSMFAFESVALLPVPFTYADVKGRIFPLNNGQGCGEKHDLEAFQYWQAPNLIEDPENFVFCSFSHYRKIDPGSFSVWMEVLKQTPGSVLWLLDWSHDYKKNHAKNHENDQDDQLHFNDGQAPENEMTTRLREYALALGVDPERLVFTPLLPEKYEACLKAKYEGKNGKKKTKN